MQQMQQVSGVNPMMGGMPGVPPMGIGRPLF